MQQIVWNYIQLMSQQVNGIMYTKTTDYIDLTLKPNQL